MNLRHISRHSSESGYALLLVLFFVALLIIGASAATLNSLTQGRRERETEMIWRGEQYERAIGLYYHHYGRFPTSLDDLIKEQPAIRFLREEYPDPMNKTDGSWRLIHVTGSGQLVGSVRYTSLQEMAMVDQMRRMGIAFNPATSGANANIFGGTPLAGASSSTPAAGSNPGGLLPVPGAGSSGGSAATGGASSQGSSTGADQQSGGSNNLPGQPVGAAPSPGPPQLGAFGGAQPATGGSFQISESSGTVFGGFIIGVASKVNKPSLKVYKGGATYKQWEFIYNPLEQTQSLGSVVTGAGAAAGGLAPLSGKPAGAPLLPPMPQIPH